MSRNPDNKSSGPAYSSAWKTLEELQEAAAHRNLDLADSDRRTGLHHAAIDRREEIARSALEAGANPNLADKRGWTPLHFAAQSYALAITQLLIAAGAKVDAQDENGNTPLSNAVFESRGRREMIDLLLKAGANPDKTNKHGVSPRSLAASIANFKVPFPPEL